MFGLVRFGLGGGGLTVLAELGQLQAGHGGQGGEVRVVETASRVGRVLKHHFVSILVVLHYVSHLAGYLEDDPPRLGWPVGRGEGEPVVGPAVQRPQLPPHGLQNCAVMDTKT